MILKSSFANPLNTYEFYFTLSKKPFCMNAENHDSQEDLHLDTRGEADKNFPARLFLGVLFFLEDPIYMSICSKFHEA